ncbi:MAG: YdcF family protein [Dysgonamonadaceae bacterium]|nr:YdcF family protein [Dysgonamonadaceae bacterium]
MKNITSKKKLLKRLKYLLIALIIATVGIVIACDCIINHSSNKLVFNDLDKIPHNKAGLLLGTSKYVRSGQKNLYYYNRIAATAALYQAGKIDFIVVSGDNGNHSYNEPLDMKNDLMAQGVPENKIFLDYAGFRTYDSVIRMDKIFGQKQFTIISQEFHNRRAIYIAKRLHFNVVAYNAKDVNASRGFKTQVRERFARVKVFVDFLTHKEPKFLGEAIEIK